MPLVVRNPGKAWLARAVQLALGELTLCLIGADITPAPDDDQDIYQEPAFPGYAPLRLPLWEGPFYTDDDPEQAEVVAPLATFTATSSPVAPVPIYGYFLRNPDGWIIWAERDESAPVYLAAAGDAYLLLPRIAVTNIGG